MITRSLFLSCVLLGCSMSTNTVDTDFVELAKDDSFALDDAHYFSVASCGNDRDLCDLTVRLNVSWDQRTRPAVVLWLENPNGEQLEPSFLSPAAKKSPARLESVELDAPAGQYTVHVRRVKPSDPDVDEGTRAIFDDYYSAISEANSASRGQSPDKASRNTGAIVVEYGGAPYLKKTDVVTSQACDYDGFDASSEGSGCEPHEECRENPKAGNKDTSKDGLCHDAVYTKGTFECRAYTSPARCKASHCWWAGSGHKSPSCINTNGARLTNSNELQVAINEEWHPIDVANHQGFTKEQGRVACREFGLQYKSHSVIQRYSEHGAELRRCDGDETALSKCGFYRGSSYQKWRSHVFLHCQGAPKGVR